MEWKLSDFAHELPKVNTTSLPEVCFNTDITTISELLQNFQTTGLQSSSIFNAFQIIKNAAEQREMYSTFLSCTSSVMASGCSHIIKQLCQLNFITLLSIPFCAVEIDIINSLKKIKTGPFNTQNSQNGTFYDIDTSLLFTFMKDAVSQAEILQSQGYHFTPQRFIRFLGKLLNNDSILTTCYNLSIPIFCPAFTDGKSAQIFANSTLVIDLVGDARGLNRCARITNQLLTICLGGGVSKHQINKASIFNERGADSAVYFISGEEFDGSDSGASPLEAMACGKLKIGGKWEKVHGEASVGFSIVGSQVVQIIKASGGKIDRQPEDVQETYWKVIEDQAGCKVQM